MKPKKQNQIYVKPPHSPAITLKGKASIIIDVRTDRLSVFVYVDGIIDSIYPVKSFAGLGSVLKAIQHDLQQ